jgi:large subunit ribosomal protein L18
MRIQKRRRREFKTDYLKRKNLLGGEKPRLVFRKTNKYFICQYVLSLESKDKVVFGLDTKKLLTYGWPEKKKGSLNSTPAAYLIGFLASKKILKEKMEIPIVDLGMSRTINKSKVYSFLKGVIDGGMSIKCKEEVFPSEERILGKHLKEDFSKQFSEIKSKIEKQ